MTQRLALHHILTTQLAKNFERDDSPRIRLSKLNTRKDKLRTSLRTIHVPARYHSMMPDTRKTYDNMVARIHETMQEVRPKRRPLPAVALPAAEIPAGSVAPPLPSTLVSKHHPKASRSGRFKGGANQSKAHVFASKSNHKPLSLIRAGLNLKVQRAKSGGGEVRSPKGFAVQKHMNEVIRQKNVLESMLMQHKRLRQDRETIVMDMQRMRADLDKICNKLDTSLQSLNSTRTLCSTAPTAKPKEVILKKVSHSGVVPHKAKASTNLASKARKGGTQKKKPHSVVIHRSGILKAKSNPIMRKRAHAE
ncbi:hypothetical protein KR054_011905 [Drosophila jambulina]|nr:hypothetical protein KR054_011905 [Drosophila jambulina]